MTKRGHTIVFISHKLDEVVAIADRVTVLRRGKVTAASVSAKGVTKAQLANLMVGREIIFKVDKKKAKPGEVVLDVNRLCCDNDRGLPALREISFQVQAGEILGLAGVAGNGQRELAEVLTGLRHPTSGTMDFSKKSLDAHTHWLELGQQLAHVPEDRAAVGSVSALSVAENLILKRFNRHLLPKAGPSNSIAVNRTQ